MYNDGSAGSPLFVRLYIQKALNFGHRSTNDSSQYVLTSTKMLEGI